MYSLLKNFLVRNLVFFLNLEKSLFYLLIFAIPFQTRTIVRSWGVGFNEWNSSFFYATDFILLAVILIWLLRLVFKLNASNRIGFTLADFSFLGLIIVSAFSILNASNYQLSFYRLTKLFEVFLLYYYVKNNYGYLLSLKTSMFVFVSSGIMQSVVGIIQLISKKSSGLEILGESPLSLGIPGVAKFYLANGEGILRAYGTMPHPNVLAAFLFLALFCCYFLYFDSTGNLKFLFLFAQVPILTGLIMTFGRLIIVLWVAGLLIRLFIRLFKEKVKYHFRRSYTIRIWHMTVITITVISFLLIFLWPTFVERFHIGAGDEAIILRSFYLKIAFALDKPFLGVGIGNFVPWLMQTVPDLAYNLYQPVHNIFGLLWAETGFLGLFFFSLFLVFLSKDYIKSQNFDEIFHYSFFIVFVSFLIIGFFDHFLLTLQQGYLMFALVLGLIGGISKRQNI